MYINNDLDYMKFLVDKKLIVFGAGSQGIKAAEKLMAYNLEVVGFCDNDSKKKNQYLLSIKVIGKLCDCIKTMGNNIIYVLAGIYKAEMKAELIENGCTYVDYDEIDFSHNKINYYDKDYFDWQREIGKFTAQFDVEKFNPYINSNNTVLEFGSGSGHLLKEIKAEKKLGIEINDYARSYAKQIGIDSVSDISLVPDEYADVIISTHVLEHVDNPIDILKGLYKKLKPYGKIVFIVPFECSEIDYHKNDINQHLYTWNGLLLGNLFNRAGFFVNKVQSYSMQWPYGSGNYLEIYKETGKDTLLMLSELFGEFVSIKEVLIVATK